MSLQRGKLADIQYVPSSVGALYANPAATKTYIRALTIFNGNATTETVKLYNVPDSSAALGTADGSNQFLQQQLAAQETLILEFPYPVVLSDVNDSLQASTTTGSKVTVQLHGDRE